MKYIKIKVCEWVSVGNNNKYFFTFSGLTGLDKTWHRSTLYSGLTISYYFEEKKSISRAAGETAGRS